MSVAYDNYRNVLKIHFDSEEQKDMGVYPEDYSTHSFRLGGISAMGADNIVTPAFIQSAIHKR